MPKYKNVALQNKDEWLRYLQKNIKNIDYELGEREQQWPKHVLTYIKK